jgi:hypothetical protein
MNERIKELAEQAGMTDDKYGMFFAKDKHDEDGVDLEKFAELIVKDTMQVVANQLPSNQYLDVAHAVIEHYKDNDVI